MIQAVIIDDVADARATLKADLADYCPQIQLIGEADSVVSGVKLLQQLKPNVVFLDINLQDGTGFDLLEILGNAAFRVIFTTASDEFAIRAFRFSAVDYLLKPVDPDELLAAVSKLEEKPNVQSEKLDLLMHSLKDKAPPRRLALHTLEKIHITQIEDIIRCESNGNYTYFYFADGQKLLVTRTLKEFDQLLEAHHFMRVHQSHLVNLDHVKEYVKTEGGYLLMSDGSHVSVSIRKKPQVIKMLESL